MWGSTASPVDSVAATAEGYRMYPLAEALRLARERDALVVLAVPLPAVDEVLRHVAEHAPGARLSDVVSVKAPVVEAVRKLTPGVRYVGGHPMAGTSSSGWASATSTLFKGAAWVVSTEPGLDMQVWQDVAALALACGAHVVPAAPDEHDAAVARISHLPHILAAVLATVGAAGGPLAMALAAGSFGDGTRVAGSRPELVRAMCEGNRDALLPALDEALGRLGAARGAFASTGSLTATITEGNSGRLTFEQSRATPRVPVHIDLTATHAVDALQGIGARGGRILGLEGTVVTAELP